MKPWILFSVFSFLQTFDCYSQNYLPEAEENTRLNLLSNVEVFLHGGTRLDFGVGEYRDNFETKLATLKEKDNTGYRHTGQFSPLWTYSLGLKTHLQFREKLNLGIGVLLTGKGFKTHLQREYNHPEYQYDEVLTLNHTVKLKSLQIPLSLKLDISRKWSIEAGPLFGFNMKSTASSQLEKSSSILINGSKDQDWSRTLESRKESLNENSLLISTGFHLAILRSLTKRVDIGLQGQFSGKYLSIGEQEVKSNSLSLFLRTQLF